MTDYLNVVKPHVPQGLISSRSVAAMEAVGRWLPGSMTRFFGFECRLDIESTDADILVCVSPYGQERDILADRCESIRLPPAVWEHPIWRQLRDFAAGWADPTSPLHERVLNMWLEFDLGGELSGAPVPCAFFGSKPPPSTQVGGEVRDGWILAEALPRLTAAPLAEPTARTLAACLQHLPAGAHVFQSGAMLTRSPALLRICVKALPPREVIPYLRAVGWPGPPDELAPLVQDLGARCDVLDVDLDIGDALGPKVGLECSFTGKPAPKDEPRWSILLGYLAERGLCVASKRGLLLAFHGHADERSDRAAWPSALLDASRLLGSSHQSTMTWRPHHIKVVYCPGVPMQAKAYLSVKHLWLRNQDLRSRQVRQVDV